MHPAYSVILFTTLSGAGYGLLAWLASLVLLGRVSTADPVLMSGLVVAVVLVTVGLLTSTAHLGRPERAWRAFSQWRTSWLSREGVAAVLTYTPVAALALDWWQPGLLPLSLVRLAAALAIVGAIGTIWCTGMIYNSLPTIRAWTHPVVTPLYVVLALASGALLLLILLAVAGRPHGTLPWLAIGMLLLAWLMKAAYWTSLDGGPRIHTIESATGLGGLGPVRQLDPPHSGANFVMREMGYDVARKHAAELRRFAVLLAFLVPIAILLALSAIALPLLPAWMTVAGLACLLGVLIERWLFFAEAEHVAMLYYGRPRA
jgi:DMSO reductase anchor subunit